MIERVIELSIRHRWLVIAAAVLLTLAGIAAVAHTPVDAVPDLSENQVIVFTDWPGHGPQEIEDQITFPLSVSLQGLAQVRAVRGTSDVNFSMIHVIFDEGVPVDAARREVSQRLARAQQSMPPGVAPYLAPESPATGQIFWYTVEGASRDLRELRELQDWYVKPQLSSVPGVAEVATVGGMASEYQIEVDPLRLKLHNVTLGQVVQAVADSNGAAAAHAIEKAGAEYVVRSSNWLGQAAAGADSETQRAQILKDLQDVVVPLDGRRSIRLGDIASVRLGPQPRRGAFEKDGNEVTGGVISMRFGENPRALTERIKAKIDELQPSLPEGVRIVPVYDRTPLINGAIRTVTRTLLEAILGASICVVLVLLHLRTSLVIAVTLPLATLSAFLVIWLLRALGIADVQTNIMTLAGIIVSIGVLVDAAIVMAENAMFTLHHRFGDQRVRGDTRGLLLPACKTVGRPIFFSILIMLLSFFPVFALEGAAGKMFRPLAVTKSAALAAAAILAITLVPALCTVLIRGRLRGERESWLVRTVMDVYRPVLNYLLSNPAPLAWIFLTTLMLGFLPLGWHGMFLATLLAGIIALGMIPQTLRGRAAAIVSFVIVALVSDQHICPLQRDVITPLNEGMVMDMPITVPLAGITQAVDDLKARDMILCRFPEVAMVVGKAGRAETPTDPAPLSMIETMVELRPERYWPRRKLRPADARRHSRDVLDELVARKLIAPLADDAACESAAVEAADAAMQRFDALLREYAYHRQQELLRILGGRLNQVAVERCVELAWENGRLERRPTSFEVARLAIDTPPNVSQSMQFGPNTYAIRQIMDSVAKGLMRLQLAAPDADLFADEPGPLRKAAAGAASLVGWRPSTIQSRNYTSVRREYDALWSKHTATLDAELLPRAAATLTRVLIEEHLHHQPILDERLAVAMQRIDRWRQQPPAPPRAAAAGQHHHGLAASPPPTHEAQPIFDALARELDESFGRRLLLWKVDRQTLTISGGELDAAVHMPGWTNVWTMPIQNRVDMLSTGVNTPVGIRVLGRKLEDVVAAAEQVGEIVKRVPGAADVFVDPIRGKGYLDVRIDRAAAAKKGVRVADVNQVVEAALGGTLATTTLEGRARYPVRIEFPRSWSEDEQAVGRLPVVARPADSPAANEHPATNYVSLSEIAGVGTSEGPATINSENGLLRCYVRANVRGRGAVDFVDDARRAVDAEARLPAGVHVEWTGQFAAEARARQRLAIIAPLVLALIAVLLYATYRDWADAMLVLLAIPGALAGGVLFQWLCGFGFSITVWIGYIACFGMAAATGVIMLVYLREAVAKAGGIESVSLAQLREAVLNGAVHRLRPKLLTEGTTLIGLAPLLWASGPGADVIRPMVAPVIGGLLVADEVIDLLLPVLFYWVRRRRWRQLHTAESTPPSTLPFALPSEGKTLARATT
ncbi:MAG: efflux RND transporter permease subunit [Pirellulales bacterium]